MQLLLASSSSNGLQLKLLLQNLIKAAEHVAELEALGIKSEEVSPLVLCIKNM